MKIKKFTMTGSIFAISLISLMSCGSHNDYSYEYEYNGCNTGKHEFDSKEAYCDALKNDELNKSCAVQLRLADFKSKCSS